MEHPSREKVKTGGGYIQFVKLKSGAIYKKLNFKSTV
jgi:hypothetical protein